MFCRDGGIFSGRAQSIQDWQDSVYFNQGLITVAETFETFATVLAVLEKILILGFPLRRISFNIDYIGTFQLTGLSTGLLNGVKSLRNFKA